MRSRTAISLLVFCAGAFAVAAFADLGSSRRHTIRNDGIFRITVVASNGMNVDPALPSAQLQSVVEATCARLLTYPDKRPPQGYTLMPEVAKSYPKITNGGKTFTFVLRRDFRFSNGARVRADAFERQIIRVLQSPEEFARESLIQDIVGADRVQNGHVEGVEAHGYRLVITLSTAVPDFPARLTAPWFCAVPPNLRVDPEGVLTFPMAGPYYVTPESVRKRRIVLRRNPHYRGSRPHHVSEVVVDGLATDFGDVLDRVLQGKADWGWAPQDVYFDTTRRLLARFGRNKSRFWLVPGLGFQHYRLNTAGALFRKNASLRRAVNFAIDRSAVRAARGPSLASRLTDQYLPPGLPGFRDAHIYRLKHPDVRTARKLAFGHLRSRRATLYTPDIPPLVRSAQVIKQDLESIGLTVEIKTFPFGEFFRRLEDRGEPWDIAWSGWNPDYLDPATYLNSLLEGDSASNLSHFDSPRYNRKLKRAAGLRGQARYREYAKLDVELARDAAPMVAIAFGNAPTLVSNRVDPRCIVLRPELDVTPVCLK